MRRRRLFIGLFFVLLITGLCPAASVASSSGDAEFLYQKAKTAYSSLKGSRQKQRYRSNWLKCIGLFEKVYRSFPESDRAADALFMAGGLYEDLYRHSRRQADLDLAISAYLRLTALYPTSRLADDGQFRIGAIHLKIGNYEQAYANFSKVEKRFPRGDMVDEARRELARLARHRPPTKRFIQVLGIRHWSSPEYTRVVIDLNGDARFEDHLLKKDPKTGKPPRVYVDIHAARINPALRQPIPIQDGLLIMARAAQYSADVVRVVLDMESLGAYRIFPLKDPSRIVLDVEGRRPKPVPPEKADRPAGKPSISRQLGLEVRRVVIDPGHGGKDPGAIGPGGLREKDVVLKIAKRLEKMLTRELGLETILTRRDDRFVPLDERTAIANTRKADLFISIHANANRRRTARGVETYVLNFATEERAIELAARENAVSKKKMSDLQYILYDLMRTAKIGESRTLAEQTQQSLYRRLKAAYPGIRDLGVKEAPFYVLIGANMPCILVEVSFISNRQEERRLRDSRYLDELARGIKEGVARYLEQIGQIPT